MAAAFRMFVRPSGPWSQFWTVFFLLFLSAWAAGVLMTPLEPVDEGLAVGVSVAVGFGVGVALLLLLAGYPLRMPRADVSRKQQPEALIIGRIFRLLFWTLVGALLFTLALRFVAW
jgi:uncharacterized membrane protein